jgi:hypothetical protein
MSNDPINEANGQNKTRVPRYYSPDHRAVILAIQERAKKTPAEEYISGALPVIMGGCRTCGSTNNSYSYRAGANGGAPM